MSLTAATVVVRVLSLDCALSWGRITENFLFKSKVKIGRVEKRLFPIWYYRKQILTKFRNLIKSFLELGKLSDLKIGN